MKFLVLASFIVLFDLSAALSARTATKLVGIGNTVKIIQAYPNDPDYPNNLQSVHAITDDGRIFYIRGGDDVIFPQFDVPEPITAMHTFQTPCGNRIKGDIYFGTKNGVYVRKGGAKNTTRLDEIDGSIKDIQQYHDKYCSLLVVNDEGKVYKITGENDSVFWQSDIPFPVTVLYIFPADGGYHKASDVYFGTTMGVYFREHDETQAARIYDINGKITHIFGCADNDRFPDNVRSVFVITKNGEMFYLRGGYEGVGRQYDVPFPVTTMYAFTEDCGIRKAGDIYFGTTYGIYLRKFGAKKSTKVGEIDKEITILQDYPDIYCSVHAITRKGEIYQIRGGDGGVFKQTDVPFPVTTMYTFNDSGGNRKAGDIYFGTTNGVFLRKA